MKYIKIIFFSYLISFSEFAFAKTETDTITNWQVYKGSTLLFRSNQVECYKLTGIVKMNDDFKSLRIVFFRDTKSYGSQKIKLFCDEKVVAEFSFENSEELVIAKSEILNLFEKNKMELTIVYYDKAEQKGMLLGHLLLEN